MQQQSSRALIFYRLLINKYFSGKVEALEKLLPEEDCKKLSLYPVVFKNPDALLFQSKRWTSSLDFSWLVPLLKTFPQELQKIYEAMFSQEPLAKPLSESLHTFLLEYAHSVWQKEEEDVLPKELVVVGDLAPLLELKKSDLIQIIDLLSMHDLIDEVRHIVDKRVLQSLAERLTLHQQKYLQKCLRQKTKPLAPSFALRKLLHEPKRFSQEIQKLGLKRFAIALSGEDKDFIWHLCHILDVDRASQLQKEIKSEAVPYATKLAQLEILQTIRFLKLGSTP